MSLLSRESGAVLALLIYLLLCLMVYGRHWRAQQAARREAQALLPAAAGSRPLLVLHASQTGQAEAIAWQTAEALHTAGLAVRLAALGEIDREQLRQAERALFIVSTYGEGDPPDSALPFTRRLMAAPDDADLGGLHIGLLALGDRSYAQYCGFGRELEDWLLRQGAKPLFERIEVDRGDAGAIGRWRQQLSHLAGTLDLPDWEAPAFESWRLSRRRLLNPGSGGGPIYHLELRPAGEQALPAWEAGDLVQVAPPADPERPREYSIASVPADGSLQLLVRLSRRDDGSPGLASGWLCEGLAEGETLPLRLRAHAGFRIGSNAARPLILIGNGSGLAGLRAHLRARAAQADAAPCWLLAGERRAAHDAHYREEFEALRLQGLLPHIDWAFSRDQAEPVYVQQRLREQGDRLRDWVARGAAIYVCGSLQGMAGGVDTVLRELLGGDAVDALQADGRYRRDVY